jgi:hypothetical protein
MRYKNITKVDGHAALHPHNTHKSAERQDLLCTQNIISSYHNSHYPCVKRFMKGVSRSVLLLHVCHTDLFLAFRGFVLRVFANWRDRLKNKNLKQKKFLELTEHPRRF